MSHTDSVFIRRPHILALLLLLLGYLVLGTTYAAQTPLFESPDESSHLQVIRYIALRLGDTPEAPREENASPGLTQWLLPYQMPARRADSGPNMAWAAGFHDPPLYYAPPLYHTLAALLVHGTRGEAPMGDLRGRLIPSPSWQAGYAPERGTDGWNKNIFVHLPTETLAESATTRAAALLRGASVLAGAVTLLCTYGLARQLHPKGSWWALVPVLILVVNPQFTAGHTGVSNDPLTVAICSAALLSGVALMRRRASWPRWALLGVLVGLGLLTKQSALLLVPVCGVGALMSAVGGRRVTTDRIATGLGRAVAFGAVAGLVGGPWYLGNLLQHGDLLGTGPHYAAQVPLARFGWDAVLRTLESYWAAFGWALVMAPGWVYGVAAAGALLAVVGLVRSVLPGGSLAARSQVTDWATRWGAGLMCLSVLLNVISFVGWAKATGAPYGRLLFPTVAATGVLWAWGLGQWQGRGWHGVLAVLGVSALAGAVLAPWVALRPAFRTPYRAGGVPLSAGKIEHVAFADVSGAALVSLEGYEVTSTGQKDGSLRLGNDLGLTLYWAADAAPGELLTVWAQLSGLDPEARVAEDTRWLGGTLYPSAYWRQGNVVAHEVSLEVPEWASAPGLYWVRVGLQTAAGQALPLADGPHDHIVLGPWRLRAPNVEVATSAVPVDVLLGDAVRLAGYEITVADDTVEVDLIWKAAAAPAGDYTVFVHMVNDAGDLVAQHDGPPASGAYPTSWWLPGDITRDRHTLDLAGTSASRVTLYVGMYDASTGERLPAVEGEAGRLPGDAILLTRIER